MTTWPGQRQTCLVVCSKYLFGTGRDLGRRWSIHFSLRCWLTVRERQGVFRPVGSHFGARVRRLFFHSKKRTFWEARVLEAVSPDPVQTSSANCTGDCEQEVTGRCSGKRGGVDVVCRANGGGAGRRGGSLRPEGLIRVAIRPPYYRQCFLRAIRIGSNACGPLSAGTVIGDSHSGVCEQTDGTALRLSDSLSLP